jgi:hypothetical protein
MALLSVTLDRSSQGSALAKVSTESGKNFSVEVKPSANATWEWKNYTRTQCWTESVVEMMVRYPHMFVFSVDANGDLTWDTANSASGSK